MVWNIFFCICSLFQCHFSAIRCVPCKYIFSPTLWEHHSSSWSSVWERWWTSRWILHFNLFITVLAEGKLPSFLRGALHSCLFICKTVVNSVPCWASDWYNPTLQEETADTPLERQAPGQACASSFLCLSLGYSDFILYYINISLKITRKKGLKASWTWKKFKFFPRGHTEEESGSIL